MIYRLFFILLFFVHPAIAQLKAVVGSPLQGQPIQIFPGWIPYHDDYQGDGITGVACSAGTKCTFAFAATTTNSATSAWVMTVVTTNNVTILRACTNDTTCASGNDNWTTTGGVNHAAPAGASLNEDSIYNVNGTVSSTSFTIVLSGNSGTVFLLYFTELIPPAGYTPTFVNGAHASSSSCTTCTMAAPTVSGTVAIVHYPQGTGAFCASWSCVSTPYFQGYNQVAYGLNLTSATAPTYTQANGAFVDTAMSFGTTVAFNADPKNSAMTVKDMAVGNFSGGDICSGSGCSYTVNVNAGDAIFFGSNNASGLGINTISDTKGSSWVIPTGASSCSIANPGNSNHLLNCAYTLSAGGSGSDVVTMKATSGGPFGVQVTVLHKTSGSWALDYHNSSTVAAGGSTYVPGVAPSITGPDACFQSMYTIGASNASPYYPIGANNLNGGQGPDPQGNYGLALLLNTANNNNTTWGATSSSEGFARYVYCFQ